MTKPRPNLFIVGAMKSGTTSLHAYLDSHPQIYMSEFKEPEYFAKESVLSNGEEWYLDLFATAKDASVIGESSTVYTNFPHFMTGVPERIAQFNPEARFIYLMRDPVQRTISDYWHRVCWFGETRDLFTAVQTDPIYTNISNYALQLEQYFNIFERDRLAIYTFEELTTNTLEVVQKLFAWLGVDATFVPPNLQQRRNVTHQEILLNNKTLLNSIIRSKQVRETLKPLFSPQILALAKRLTGQYVDRNSPETTILIDKTIEFLKPIQSEQVTTLSKMLNRRFPEWKTLSDSQTKLEKETSA